MAVAVVVCCAVVALAAPLLPWLVARAGDPDALGGLGVFALAVVVGAVAMRDVPSSSSSSVSSSPARPSLLAGAALLFLGIALDVRIVQMAGVFCVAHAAVAVVAPRHAVALRPALALLLLGLPLAGDLDVVGFPARVFAARVAAAVLAAFGKDAGGAETVLVVEGDVADVEAPCAGLATVRLLCAVVVAVGALRKSALPRVGVAVVVAGAVAVVGNALRVSALASLVLVAHRADLARLVHVPLGVVVFAGAVVVADRLLRGAPAPSPWPKPAARADVVALVVVAALAALLRLQTPERPAPLSFSPSPDAIALTPAEDALFSRHALFAEKRLIDGGSALVVVATSLRAHHAPERCLAGSGLRVDASESTTIAGVPVKRLVLDGGARVGVSFYVRDDGGQAVVVASLVERALDALVHRGAPWAFVSLIVDDDADVEALVPALVDEAERKLSPAARPSSSARR